MGKTNITKPPCKIKQGGGWEKSI